MHKLARRTSPRARREDKETQRSMIRSTLRQRKKVNKLVFESKLHQVFDFNLELSYIHKPTGLRQGELCQRTQ